MGRSTTSNSSKRSTYPSNRDQKGILPINTEKRGQKKEKKNRSLGEGGFSPVGRLAANRRFQKVELKKRA